MLLLSGIRKSLDCRFSLRTKRLSKPLDLPIAFQTNTLPRDCRLNSLPRDCQCFALSAQSIGLTQSSRLPMLCIVFQSHWINPKPFKQTLCVRLAFLLLVCLRKQVFDTSSKQKSLPLT